MLYLHRMVQCAVGRRRRFKSISHILSGHIEIRQASLVADHKFDDVALDYVDVVGLAGPTTMVRLAFAGCAAASVEAGLGRCWSPRWRMQTRLSALNNNAMMWMFRKFCFMVYSI